MQSTTVSYGDQSENDRLRNASIVFINFNNDRVITANKTDMLEPVLLLFEKITSYIKL